MNWEGAHIRVLLAEDHTLMRQMTRGLLEDAGFQVVAEAADGVEAVALTIEHAPDVVLMDLSMPRLGGLDATREVTKRCPGVRVLVLTVHDEDQYLFASLEAGAVGYLRKTATTSDLVEAVRRVHRGQAVLSPQVIRKVVKHFAENPRVLRENLPHPASE